MSSKTGVRNYISLYSCLKQTHYGYIPIENKISIRSEDKNQESSTIITVKTNSFYIYNANLQREISQKTNILKTVPRNPVVKRIYVLS